MKKIKKMTAALLCIAVTGSLAATAAFADGGERTASGINTASGTSVTLDLTKVLSEQDAGTVTVALLSKATNSTEMADSYFKDVTLTRTTPAADEPEPVYTEAYRVAPEAAEAETRDAVGFKYEFNVGEETAVTSLTCQVTYDGQMKTVDGGIPKMSGGSYIVGLLITELPDNITPEDVSAYV